MDNKKMRDTFALPIDKKSRILALVLWFFLGAFGVHRMYLGRAGSGVVMALLTLIGGATAAIGIGFVFLAIVAIWWVLDFILIFRNCWAPQQRGRFYPQRPSAAVALLPFRENFRPSPRSALIQ